MAVPEFYNEKCLSTNLEAKNENSSFKKFSGVEQKVYDYLKDLGLNPQRVYKWFLSSRLPEDLKTSLLSGKISQRKAISLARNKEFSKELDITWRLMDLIRKTVHEVV